MTVIRDKARDVLKTVPEPPAHIASKGSTSNKWNTMIPINQEKLEANWAKGGWLTCCMEFVGWYGRNMGAKVNLGRFDLITYLPTIGKKHTWIPSGEGIKPNYGDIYLVDYIDEKKKQHLHIGVALDPQAGKWNHVDAGQGGPNTGYDILKRTYEDKDFEYKKVRGWIDIELYFSEKDGPMPTWLPGWWVVQWRGDTYYYHLTSQFKAIWSEIRPANAWIAPRHVEGAGVVILELDGSFTIRWDSGTRENFWVEPSQSNKQMSGTWNAREPISARKL